jgi:hypothetical protein
MKLKGLAPLRGMGLMMIAQLVDEAGFTESQDGGNHFRLALIRRVPNSAAHASVDMSQARPGT